MWLQLIVFVEFYCHLAKAKRVKRVTRGRVPDEKLKKKSGAAASFAGVQFAEEKKRVAILIELIKVEFDII